MAVDLRERLHAQDATLTSLSLSDNAIGEARAASLADALHHKNTLTSLFWDDRYDPEEPEWTEVRRRNHRHYSTRERPEEPEGAEVGLLNPGWSPRSAYGTAVGPPLMDCYRDFYLDFYNHDLEWFHRRRQIATHTPTPRIPGLSAPILRQIDEWWQPAPPVDRGRKWDSFARWADRWQRAFGRREVHESQRPRRHQPRQFSSAPVIVSELPPTALVDLVAVIASRVRWLGCTPPCPPCDSDGWPLPPPTRRQLRQWLHGDDDVVAPRQWPHDDPRKRRQPVSLAAPPPRSSDRHCR
jgi:hypothetical protein